MKKIFIASILFLFVISFSYAQSQTALDSGKTVASIGLTGAMPMSDFKEVYKLGFGGTIDVAHIFTKNVAGRLELTINNFLFDKDKYSLGTPKTVTGGGLILFATKLSFCGGLIKPQPGSKFSIYGIFSLGAYFASFGEIEELNTVTGITTIIPGSSYVYMGMGAGVRFGYQIHPKASLFLESGYETFFPAEKWNKANIGVRNDFIPVKLGVTIHSF